jgi:hypothetical protein
LRAAGGEWVLVRVPPVAEQDVELEAAGSLVLELESPPLTTPPRRRTFSLREHPSGCVVPMRAELVPTRSSGFTRARLAIQRFALEAPGTYTLRVDGLVSGEDA